MTIHQLVNAVTGGRFDDKFRELYGNSERGIMKQRARYIDAAEHFSRKYPECDDVRIFSSPVSVPVGGESTYHQGGFALAATVSPDLIAVVCENEDGVIRIDSPDLPCFEIKAGGRTGISEEINSYPDIVRNIIALDPALNDMAVGFNAYITSDIPSGHGFSEAAAFAYLIGIIINNYYNSSEPYVAKNAKLGANADLEWTAGALGGVVLAEPRGNETLINAVDCDFPESGYSLCITAVGGDDGEPADGMKEAAEYFGKPLLCEVDEDEFYGELPEMLKSRSDTAVLSAIRFFEENRRVSDEAEALKIGDTEEFFKLADSSGEYSADGAAAVAVAVGRRFLGGSGAVRICGGGIVQAFVPSYLAMEYAEKMNSLFGGERCLVLGIRSKGVTEIILD